MSSTTIPKHETTVAALRLYLRFSKSDTTGLYAKLTTLPPYRRAKFVRSLVMQAWSGGSRDLSERGTSSVVERPPQTAPNDADDKGALAEELRALARSKGFL